MFSAAITLLYNCRGGMTTMDQAEMNGVVCVPIKLYLQRQAIGRI